MKHWTKVLIISFILFILVFAVGYKMFISSSLGKTSVGGVGKAVSELEEKEAEKISAKMSVNIGLLLNVLSVVLVLAVFWLIVVAVHTLSKIKL